MMRARAGGGGGIAARRAVARWAVRLFRRDWRQQRLIIAMMIFAVAVAVFGVSAAYNVIVSSEGEFGSASHRFRFAATDVTSSADTSTSLAAWFGPIEVIGHHAAHVPGAVATLDVRRQDPSGPFGGPMLRLRQGRYPTAPSEVAVTDGAAERLGMFLANGATDRHLRLVMLTNGAVVGAIAAVGGALVGLSTWVVVAPHAETAAGHRIDRFHLPIWLIAAALVLAVLISIGASTKPARTIARVSIMGALAARPPDPLSIRRSAVVAVALIAGGVIALSRAIDISADTSNPALLIGGVIALTVGIVVLAPSVLAGLERVASHAPLAPRLALRDLARYRARSSTALAAISLSLAFPLAVIVIAAAAKHGADRGNLSEHQMIVRIGDDPLLVPQRSAAQITGLQATVDSIATQVKAKSIELLVAIDAGETLSSGADTVHRAVVLGRTVGGGTLRDIGVLYVATPPVVVLLGLPADTVDVDVDVLTPSVGDLGFSNSSARDQPSTMPIRPRNYSSAPTSLITPASMRRHGWKSALAGWLLQSTRPITAAERRSVRQEAARLGLTAEFRDEQGGLGTVQTAATIVGLLLALAIVALTLGLLQAETTNQIRTLTATGATSRFRRALRASAAAALALAGVLLGTVTAYGALIAGYASKLDNLGAPPLAELGLIVIGAPTIAAVGSWLLAGREPPTLTRAPLE